MTSKTITLSLKEEVEKELRRLALQKFGRTKGNLAKVVTEGIMEVKKKQAKKETVDPVYLKFSEFMKKIEGKGYGGLKKYKREELYER
jgi:hypothetical protein